MVGAGEGDLEEADGGVVRESGAELSDVERRVDEGYGEAFFAFYLQCQR